MEKRENQKIWLKLGIVLILIVALVAILYYVNPQRKNNVTSNYVQNIDLMKNAGFEYFQEENLPTEIGEKTTINLDEMVGNNLLADFTVAENNTCSKKDSYIEVTKTLDNEYSMKVYLSCNDKQDYIVTNIVNNNLVAVSKPINENIESSLSSAGDLENNYVEDTYEYEYQSSRTTTYKPDTSLSNVITNITNYNINYVNNCGCTNNYCGKCVVNIYHTVSFDANGGSAVKDQVVKDGDLASYRATTRDGYNFLGWYLNGAKYDFDTPVTERITLVAKWEKAEKIPTTYIVHFNSNGGSLVSDIQVTEGDIATRPNNPTKACYSFAGWYTDSSLTNQYNFNSPVNSNITLYAKWVDDGSCHNTYNVTFNTNGGSYVAPLYELEEGSLVTKPANPTKACYSFAGWYTNASLTKSYNFNTGITRDLTLYAKWVDDGSCKNTYSVTYNSNGGSYVNPEYDIPEGSRATKPANPTKACYSFAGWYTNTSLTKSYNFNTAVTSNITLYAKWVDDGSCKNTYTVTYNSNGGSYVSPEYDIPEGSRATKPANPTKACYSFAGWYTNSGLTKSYSFSSAVTSNLTLYAKWIEDGSCKSTYTVSYNSNGGSYVSPESVTEGSRATNPGAPSRSGYRFLGWYYNGKTFNFNTKIYQNYTLIAKWEKEEEKYYTYCKLVDKRYYSTGYTQADIRTYNWTIKFDDLYNVKDLVITKVGYITSDSMYNEVYKDSATKGISMEGGDPKYEVAITSGSMLKKYSLKSTNFTKSLTAPYYSGGVWKTNASVSIKNYTGATKYYPPNLTSYIYFMPFYFDVRYTDMNNCVDDKASNQSKYSNYKIMNTYYR